MDKRIFITLIAIILLIGAFIGIRAMLGNQCQIPEITVEPASPEAGQIVKFSCTNTEDNITWNFADGKSSSGSTAEHRFDSPGTYNVSAKVNDDCSNSKEVIVREQRKVVTVAPVISMPSEIHAGEEARFSETTSGAGLRKWTVKETNETGEGETFSTTFKSQGKYHLSVSLSGNYVTGDSTYSIDVLKAKPVVKPAPVYIPEPPKPKPVKPKPEPEPKPKPEPKPAPTPKPARYLSDDDFTTRFEQIAKGLGPGNADIGQAADDWRDVIAPQVCSGQFLTILIGDQPLSDSDFRRRLISGQTSDVEVSKIVRGNDNCVSKVIVKAKSR